MFNAKLLPAYLMVFHCCLLKSEENFSCNRNKYSASANAPQLSTEEMYYRGHMKPFGSHRPPMDVEILKYMISPQDFYMNFVVKHKPVIIKGVTKSWPAYQLWTDEYMEKKYGENIMQMETKDDDKYDIPPSRKFKDFLKVYKSSKSKLYLVDEVTPEMREEVLVPQCLQCEEIDRFFFVSYYWHSNGGTMSTVHIDTDENLLCLISGHKKVILVSPLYSHDLYADSAKQMGVLDLNASAVDLDRYPSVMNIHYYEATVEEGDCVYIPQMWWHQVYSRQERQQAIAMWWKSKPFWKKMDQENSLSKSIPLDKQREHSYADALIDYENWVQNVSLNVPLIKCKEQFVKMSAYNWETDKETEEKVQTLGDGGDLEEIISEEVEAVNKDNTVTEVLQKVKEARSVNGKGCDFDRTNKKSPCNLKVDAEDELDFVKKVMDYCKHFEDRGCVINKPQLLNKLMKKRFELISR